MSTTTTTSKAQILVVAPKPLWREEAACTTKDPETFYPASGEDARPAKTVCAGCDVRLNCLSEAMSNGERYGIWGGTTAKERDAMRRSSGKMTRPNEKRDAAIINMVVAGGRTTAEIANSFSITPRTVLRLMAAYRKKNALAPKDT